jgi:hypothetical protein
MQHCGCACATVDFGRGQNIGVGWSDPTFAQRFRGQSDPWGRSSPSRRKREHVLPARMQKSSQCEYNGDHISNEERRKPNTSSEGTA